MKPNTTIDLISTFRKKINIQFLVILLVTASLFFTSFFIHTDDPFYSGAKLMGNAILIIATSFLYQRRSHLFEILQVSNMEMITALHAYMENYEQRWVKTNPGRLIVGVMLTIGMLFLLIYFRHTRWAGMVTMIWFGLILGSMAIGWMLMNDHIMLQDLKRRLRENHSKIAE